MQPANSPTLMSVRGSRLRCILLTGLPRHDAARILTDLTNGQATVTSNDEWLPEGILNIEEAKVHRKFPGIDSTQCKQLMDWWLHVQHHANTPNWDVASTCTVKERKGLLLVEAKAHKGELSSSGHGATNPDNQRQIERAIDEANVGLNAVLGGWALRHNQNYQVANRFAWAWKIATIGIPVVLIYLGFRNAEEMGNGMFATHDDWERCVLAHTDGVVPRATWGSCLDIGGTPLIPQIRSLDLTFQS